MQTCSPVMCDVAGTELTERERARLRHALVGGLILFARNFTDSAQLRALTNAIRAERADVLIAVDHEGGRVQRFRGEGFTTLPPMRALGELAARNEPLALVMAHAIGLVLAAELLAHGVDLSFAPVLDLDYGCSRAIGDRALCRDAHLLVRLAGALTDGMARAGMRCVGKHFPGHGFVEADSHVDMPRDERPLAELLAEDAQPYRAEALGARLGGVMPAHVIYPAVDAQPAGFSRRWLQDVLRGELGYRGAIFSDDLSMRAASVAGDVLARAEAARAAGCDMVLVCNSPREADDLLTRWQPPAIDGAHARIQALRGDFHRFPSPDALAEDAEYQAARAQVCRFVNDAA